MAINISAKTDYSMLFSSLPTRNNNVTSSIFGGTAGSSFSLSDYALIKNGSYGKLMKAYYSQGDDSSGRNSAVNKVINGGSADKATTITALKGSSDKLAGAAEDLTTTGKDSLFVEKDITTKDENGVETTAKGYDKDAIYKKVSEFVDAYNSVLSAAGKSDNVRVLNTGANMTTMTAANESMLSKVGITIGEDNKLSIDEKAFKEADMGSVKTMFNGVTSYAYDVQTKASFINMYAKEDAAKTSGIYAQNALYNNSYSSSGYLFDNMF